MKAFTIIFAMFWSFGIFIGIQATAKDKKNEMPRSIVDRTKTAVLEIYSSFLGLKCLPKKLYRKVRIAIAVCCTAIISLAVIMGFALPCLIGASIFWAVMFLFRLRVTSGEFMKTLKGRVIEMLK